MKAPRSARPVGADHSLQRAARFRFPKTGIVPAVLIRCGGIWWWLSRTPDSVYRRTPGMREPSYRRACNPEGFEGLTDSWREQPFRPAIRHTGPKRPCRRLLQWGAISSFDRYKRATSVGRSEWAVARTPLPNRWRGRRRRQLYYHPFRLANQESMRNSQHESLLSVEVRQSDHTTSPLQEPERLPIPATFPDRKSTRLNSSHLGI